MNRPRSSLLAVWAALLLPGLSTLAQDPAPTPAFTLPPAVAVDGTGVHLDEVLVPPPDAPLPHLRLAAAPAFGQSILLTRAAIDEALRQHCPSLAGTPWVGATAVRVTRRIRPLEETELKDLLTAALQEKCIKDSGELELRFPRPWTTVQVPDDPLTVRLLDVPTGGLGPYSLVRFDLLAGAERVGGWQLALQARIWREIPVARTAANRGQRLAEADPVLERRDSFSVRETLPATALQDDTLELAENVRPGQPLLARAVRVRPLVRRGGLVEGRVQDGLLHISLKVEVLEDGLPGQTIRVRNPKTRREFIGKVHDEQTVLLVL